MITYETLTQKMLELFADNIVVPEHSPEVFSYQVKLAKWMLENNKVESKDPQ